MKRMIAFLLAVLMLLSLAACAGTTEEEETTGTASGTVTEATDASTEPEGPADLQALYDTLAEKMPEMIQMDETTMLNFCGIAAEDCTQVAAAICADGLRTDEVWLIEAVDEAALARLKTLAETRLEMKGEESITYSPEQYAVVQKAQLITNGLYLALIVSPDVDTLAQIVNDTIG